MTRLALAALGMALAPSTTQADPAPHGASSFLHTRHGAVASDSAIASRVGAKVLAAGGNAVDAACATTLALGVVHPFASGLGGGGFALVYLAKPEQAVALDFRETAPAGFRAPDGVIPPQSKFSVGVPGEAAGLAELVYRFGALPFSRCVAPARRLARGFPASPWLVAQIQNELTRHPLDARALLAQVFDLRKTAADGIRPGNRLARPQLAKTLAKLQSHGARALYTGATGRALVAALADTGMSLADLSGYRPIERVPLVAKLRGKRVLLMPPPSAAGVILTEALGMLGDRCTGAAGDGSSPEQLHLLAEVLKHGFADRARFLGDPAFLGRTWQHLLAPAYHRELAARIRPDRVLEHDRYGAATPPAVAPARDAGTAHVSVVDRHGNAVALTTTINLEFGARIVAGPTGIVLNDELDDFASAPGRPDVFALAGGNANRPAPGKRPVSSMSPTIVLGEHGVELVTGAAGGPRIVSATLQVLLGVLCSGRSARQAIEAPRIHHQWEPDVLWVEPGIPAETVRALEQRGHHVQQRADIAKANLILRSPSGLDAVADPRAGGAPAGY